MILFLTIVVLTGLGWFVMTLIESSQDRSASPLGARIEALDREYQQKLAEANKVAGTDSDMIDKIDPNPHGGRPNLEAMRKEKCFFSQDELQPYELEALQNILNGLIVQTHDITAVLREANEKRPALEELLEEKNVKLLFTNEPPSEYKVCKILAPIFDLQKLDMRIHQYYDWGRIIVPEHMQLVDTAIRMDGGSKIFIFQDLDSGANLEITLMHYNFESISRNPTELTGALYYEGVLVPVRSELERVIMERMRLCAGINGKQSRSQQRLAVAVYFIESDDYIEIAKLEGRILA
jgi:hypothetical protein